MSRTRIKICGLTRPQDVRAAVEHGADAIGFVFYPHSPRAVGIEQAAELVKQAGADIAIPFVAVGAGGDFVEIKTHDFASTLHDGE